VSGSLETFFANVARIADAIEAIAHRHGHNATGISQVGELQAPSAALAMLLGDGVGGLVEAPTEAADVLGTTTSDGGAAEREAAIEARAQAQREAEAAAAAATAKAEATAAAAAQAAEEKAAREQEAAAKDAAEKAAAAKAAEAPKISLEKLRAALVEFRTLYGTPAMMDILKTKGGVVELATLPPAKYQDVYNAVTKE